MTFTPSQTAYYGDMILRNCNSKESFPIEETSQLKGEEQRKDGIYSWVERDMFTTYQREGVDIITRFPSYNFAYQWVFCGGYINNGCVKSGLQTGVPIIFAISEQQALFRWRFINFSDAEIEVKEGARIVEKLADALLYSHRLMSFDPIEFIPQAKHICSGCKFDNHGIQPRCAVHPYGPVSRTECKDKEADE